MTERQFLIQWNNRRPLDREYRKKYNIPFNSPQHRAISQIDIFLEYCEDALYKEFVEKAREDIEREQQYEKGIWLKEQVVDDAKADELWDKMDLSTINSQSDLDE